MTLMGIGRGHSRLTPPGPHGSLNKRFKYKKILLLKFIIVENCGVKHLGTSISIRDSFCILSSFVYRMYIYIYEMYNSKCVYYKQAPDSKNY